MAIPLLKTPPPVHPRLLAGGLWLPAADDGKLPRLTITARLPGGGGS
ncbi:MAG: hypothetical protein SFX18_01645 [Pirellulales bacterium]|nr:hypothetical protein [Pirellulales bacterium]